MNSGANSYTIAIGEWSLTGVALTPGVNRLLIQAFDATATEFERSYYEVWYDDSSVVNVSTTGDETSGDGWRYRGMGAIQLTGKANYLKTGQRIGEDLVNHPELLLTPRVGAKAAVAYWVRCDLNDEADREDHIEITRAINGNALAGLAERRTEYRRLRSLWG